MGTRLTEVMSKQDTRLAMWKMRTQGRTVQDIAREFGVSPRQVHYYLRDAVQLIDATQWLEVETQTDLDRLEALFEAYWADAVGLNSKDRDKEAATLILRILAQKAQLLGLNAPKRVDISVLIAEWAERKGLSMDDVKDVTYSMFPRPEVKG